MKINNVLSEIRKGNLVFNLKVVSPKGYDKNVEEISIATTLYYKKHVNKQEGDEIVVIYGKEFNVSEFERIVRSHAGSEICARLGNQSIVIEWDAEKTQINGLINGQKKVIRDENHAKYSNAPKATSHEGFGGTNVEVREEIAAKVFAENPESILIEARGKQFTLKRCYTTTGKTSWYEASVTANDFLLLTGYKMLPYANEAHYMLKIEPDMKVCIVITTRSNERAQWKYSSTIYLGEELITIL